MSQIEVDFVLRSDTWSKPGGDLHQVQKYCEHLGRLGVDAQIMEFKHGLVLRDESIVHIVNVDRPFDFIEMVRASVGHVIVVSPIHHDLAAVRQMRNAEHSQGLRSVVGRILPEWAREWLAFVVRSLVRKDRSSVWSLGPSFFRTLAVSPRIWRKVGRHLDEAHSVLLLAEGEGTSLSFDTGWSGRNGQIVPNGAPDDLPCNTLAWVNRSEAIIVAGRIEPRKRQLEIARRAAEHGTRIEFVGPINKAAAQYGGQFVSEVDKSEYLSWAGPLSHVELVRRMAESKVLLNASWVEVQSLVDLEASFAGCYVVARSAGNSAEWLPEHVTAIATSDLDTLLHEATRQVRRHAGPGLPIYPWTWQRCAQSLRDVYTGLVVK